MVAVLPAHAGMIPPKVLSIRVTFGAPRACGDDPMDHVDVFTADECSPRMRG